MTTPRRRPEAPLPLAVRAAMWQRFCRDCFARGHAALQGQAPPTALVPSPALTTERAPPGRLRPVARNGVR